MRRFVQHLGSLSCLFSVLAGTSSPVAAQKETALGPYEACLEAMISEAEIEQRIQRCQVAAEAGIPTAQYLLGMMLLDGDVESPPHVALRWLLLAAERGHPGAQLEASRRLREGPAGRARPEDAAEYLRRAVCSGLPAAHLEARQRGLDPAEMECGVETWGGTWAGEVQWVFSSLGEESSSGRSLRVRIHLGADVPHLETWNGAGWTEIKPGGFKWLERGTNGLLIALDEGWDLDGRWEETSSLALVRIAPDEIQVVWTRIIHNEHLPRTLEGRTLTAVAHGTLRRTADVAPDPHEEPGAVEDPSDGR